MPKHNAKIQELAQGLLSPQNEVVHGQRSQIPLTEMHSTGSSMFATQCSNRNRAEHDLPFVLMVRSGLVLLNGLLTSTLCEMT